MVNYTPAVVGKTELKEGLKPGLTIRDYVAKNFQTISNKSTILEASEMLIRFELTGAPVVDENGSMIGFLSEKDCLKYILDSKYYNHAPSSATHYMSTQVMSISPDDSLTSVVELFLRNNFQVYPVVEEGRVIGTVSRKAILQAVAELNESSW
ncbi:CBS domain-containing protein [Halobacteriovorax marinus]|uniref:CBS domain-containing protein n=1 Tax=Halobacteriovorax marinus TaxID=97084 RepID=UPI000BDE73DA|nr:CBS domain-containing protein [Halobacteriovorax marinus]